MSDPVPSNITFHQGDLFASGADALLNPVNCVGVMGAGLAKQFKDRDALMFSCYREQCSAGGILPGRPSIYLVSSPAVIFFPTKLHWRDPSQLRWVRDGLKDLRGLLPQWELASIAVPPLGCGLGGLAWPAVRDLIVEFLGDLSTTVMVYGTAPDA